MQIVADFKSLRRFRDERYFYKPVILMVLVVGLFQTL